MLRKYPFRFHTVRSRLTAYALTMLIPVLLFAGIYFIQSQKILESKAGDLVSESLDLSMSWMDEVLAGSVRLSTAVESDSVLRNFFMEHQDTDLSRVNVLEIRQMEERLSEILGTEKRATSIWVYFPETREVLSTQYGHYQAGDDGGFDWLKKQMPSDQPRTWIYPDQNAADSYDGSFLDITSSGRKSPNVTFARAIPGLGNPNYPLIVGVGYLEFTLQDIFHEVSTKTQTALILIDHTGHIVDTERPIGTKPVEMEDVLDKLNHRHASNSRYFITDNRLIATSTSALTGWKVIAVAPLSKYMGGVQLLTWLTISFAVCALLFAIFMVRSLMTQVHVPLRQLLNGMKRMENGDLSVRIHNKRPDEFQLLADGFNRMAETQDHLIRTVYEERFAKQQAELNYLTSQINPHFLYNTLGALYTMARKTDTMLADALLSMSRLFRLSLSRGSEMISVEESLEHILNYINLFNIRNPGKIRLETYIEPGSERCLIPKLMLQPIVENSIHHGLEPVKEQGFIRIAATLLTNDLLLMVTDNGIGMDAEALQRLRSELEQQDERTQDAAYSAPLTQGSGYAMRNIYRRLKLKYGSRFMFQVESERNKGTVISIRIPR